MNHLPEAVLLDLDDTILDDSGNVSACWLGACVAYQADMDGLDPVVVHESIKRTRAWFWADPERHRVGRLNLVTRFGLTELFDVILIEGEVGFGKPDPRIYMQALDEVGVAPADTWMVGDNLEWDVAGPQRQGIAGIWIDVRGSELSAGHAVRPNRIIRRLADLREDGAAQVR